MSRILVTGATGFVGKSLVQYLSRQGHAVTAVTRQPVGKPDGASEVIVVPDIAVADWTDVLQGIDAIVHLAARVHQMKEKKGTDPLAQFMAVNRDGTVRLAIAAAAQGVKRFIFVSSVKAAVDHTSPNGVDETIRPEPHSPYGISKRQAEIDLMNVAAEVGMGIVILRLPLVYGPGVKANFARLVKMVRLQVPLPFGGVINRRSMLGLTNLLTAVASALSSPAVAGKVFFLSDGAPVSTPDLVRAIARALKKKIYLVNVPPRLMREAAEVVHQREKFDRLMGSLVVDNSRFRSATGWEPEPMAAELERLVASLYPKKN